MNHTRTLFALVASLVLAAPAQAAGNAAEVVLVTGVATVGARALSPGDKLSEGDTIVTGNNSYANLKFADGGRVLLRPNTEFTVEKYKYEAPARAAAAPAAADAPAEASSAFFRLVRGGFRAISGFIGKADRQSYRVTTPTATIGIRGTDYEAQLCAADCPEAETTKASADPVEVASSDLRGLQLAQAGGSGGGAGLVVATNEGSVVLQTPRGEFTVDAGQVALATANGQVFQLPAVPDLMLRNPTPSPERCQ